MRVGDQNTMPGYGSRIQLAARGGSGGGGGGGAFTFVQKVDGSAMASPGTVAITPTSGNNLILLIRWDTPTANISSITCTSESNGVVRGTKGTSGSLPSAACQIADVLTLTSGGAKTVTVNMSASTGIEVCAVEFTGSMTFDVANNATGSGANATVAVTTTVLDDLLIGLKLDLDSPGTAGSGFTLITLNELANNDVGEYNLAAGAAGSKNVDFTSNAAGWILNAAGYKH